MRGRNEGGWVASRRDLEGRDEAEGGNEKRNFTSRALSTEIVLGEASCTSVLDNASGGRVRRRRAAEARPPLA